MDVMIKIDMGRQLNCVEKGKVFSLFNIKWYIYKYGSYHWLNDEDTSILLLSHFNAYIKHLKTAVAWLKIIHPQAIGTVTLVNRKEVKIITI